jgi:hypothetical protein
MGLGEMGRALRGDHTNVGPDDPPMGLGALRCDQLAGPFSSGQ